MLLELSTMYVIPCRNACLVLSQNLEVQLLLLIILHFHF